MKAIVCTRYGPPEVLKIVDIALPVPADHQVLIKVFFTTVTIADSRVRGFNVPLSFWLPAKLALGFTKPRQAILGTEVSGVVEKAGKNVRKFKAGDAVFAFPGEKGGAYAEYICMDENACIAPKPARLSFKQAAALSLGGITAWFFLEKGKVQKGDKILIYGASGSNGTAAVQIAKYLGAEVTAVCGTGNVDMVKALGADSVIDYTQTDFTETGETFDVVFDAVGKANIRKTVKVIRPGGRYLHAVTTPLTQFKIWLNLLGTKIKLIGGTYSGSVEQINFIRKLAEEGHFTPVIDKQYRFEEIADAHAYVDKGHKKGNVVIQVNEPPDEASS